MKRLMIAAVAPLALALPAYAQHGHGGHAAHPPAAAKPAAAKPAPKAAPAKAKPTPKAAPKPAVAKPAPKPADPHAGHAMPTAADPHAGHAMPPAVDPHAGHATAPAQPADPHAGHKMPTAADPHAGHTMPPASDPHAGHAMPPAQSADPHAGHAGHSPAPADPHAGHNTARVAIGSEPAPPPPMDHAAERFYSAAEMAPAREQLRREHGDVRWSKVMLESAEIRPDKGADAYAWEAEASFGDDRHRFVLKSQGEGASDDLESAEIQALYGRAIDPYFNVLAGLRHDLEPGPARTYATLGFEGVAPYWFEVEGAVFLSNKGDVSARLEGSYDFRLTQRLILEPRVEANLAASADEARHEGSGLRDIELGLRLRYAITQEFAPYLGVHWERKFGDTADLARGHGEGVQDTRVVIGLRAWF